MNCKSIIDKMRGLALCCVAAFAMTGCTQERTPWNGGEGEGLLRLSVALPETRATEAEYDARALGTLRIYQVDRVGDEATERLIRKYRPVTDVPAELYLAAGEYKVTVEAGDGSEATFTRKSYYGEESFQLGAHDVKTLPVVCKLTNIAVKVVFDPTVAEAFDQSRTVFVSAADAFDESAAREESVPTLQYTEDGTGYFLLPEGTANLSWGFFGESSNPDLQKNGTRDGVIEQPQGGMQYTLTFKYSPSAPGQISVGLQVREYESTHDDNFVFSPQPTFGGQGFSIDQVTGFHVQPVGFTLTSINALSSVALTAGGTRYEVMTDGRVDETLAAQGIVYTPTDALSGVLTLGEAFFAKLPAGIQSIGLEAVDAGGGEGEATGRVAVAGATGFVSADLWSGTGTLGAVVTDPATTAVQIRFREAGADAEWTLLSAVKGDDGYSYTAAAEGLRAGLRYEFQLVENGAERGALLTQQSEAGIQLPNAGFEEWYYDGKSWFPYATGGTPFWGTGNPGATSVGSEFNLTAGVEDPRPGSAGTTAAKLETKKPSIMGIGKLAAGNLFVGEFGAVSGMGGTVHMGRPFTFNARPTALRVWYKYTPQGSDKGRIYLCLVNMTDGSTYHVVDTNNPDKTTFSPDDEFLYSDKTNPATLQGHVIGYGDLMLESAVTGWTEVEIPITYREQYASERPNVLLVTAAASYRGDYFEGEVGSTLYLDDVEFVY